VPLHSGLPAPMDASALEDDTSDDDDDDDDDDADPPHPFAKYAGIDPDQEQAQITPLEVIVMMLDWMHCHKVTDAALDDLWARLQMALGPTVPIATFEQARNIIKNFRLTHVTTVHLCVNDCIVFYDVQHIPEMMGHQHARRTHCPHCNEPRWVTGANGIQQPRKVVYH
jgi:hypothetical protein